jgi:PAS domain S-box-containing protein
MDGPGKGGGEHAVLTAANPDGPPLTSGLRSAEESALAAIVRSSHDAVIAKTVEGIITAWNDGAALVYGHTADQMIGQSVELTIPPEALEEERARHARVAEGAHESGYRCVRLRADGRRITVVMSMSPVRDATARIVGVASISRPVSDKESADSRVSSLLEAAPDAMVCVDCTGRIALVNAQVTALFGYSRDELIGASIESLLPEDVRSRHVGHRSGFFGHPRPRSMGAGLSLRARRKDGSTFPVEVSLAADINDGETLAIAAIRDVTDQRATEAALRESETRLRQLAEHVDTVFTLRQLEPFVYLYVSPGFRKLTGFEPEELIAHPDIYPAMIHPEDRDRAAATYFVARDAGRTAQSEHRIVRPDGEVRWIRSFTTPVPNPHGPPERVVTTTEDITEQVKAGDALREAEATARAASEAKNEFLSRMSHELRTPLNAVLGFGQLLELHLTDTADLESVRHIVRAGRHLLALINEVLDFARIEAGELSVSPEPVALASIVDETALLMQPIADAVNVSLVVAGGPAAVYTLADRRRLRQILLNLISNAIKYNRAGGNVWLSWRIEQDRASITVRDDGPGISSSLHHLLFTPFDRLGAEATGIEGTGVGLTVSRGLAELMNGELSFESELGQGTSFSVKLPLSQEPVAQVPVEVASKASRGRLDARTKSETLLYIEDNEPNVRVMESVLELRPQWRLIHAGLASLGLELARAHRPDLVLLDLHLPDGSGLDVLTALKNDEATADTRVVILTADASHQQLKRLMAAGAAQYLTKPLDLAEVFALLDAVTDDDRPAAIP